MQLRTTLRKVFKQEVQYSISGELCKLLSLNISICIGKLVQVVFGFNPPLEDAVIGKVSNSFGAGGKVISNCVKGRSVGGSLLPASMGLSGVPVGLKPRHESIIFCSGVRLVVAGASAAGVAEATNVEAGAERRAADVGPSDPLGSAVCLDSLGADAHLLEALEERTGCFIADDLLKGKGRAAGGGSCVGLLLEEGSEFLDLGLDPGVGCGSGSFWCQGGNIVHGRVTGSPGDCSPPSWNWLPAGKLGAPDFWSQLGTSKGGIASQ